jgi:glucose-6-phosphate 1-dehydrogenase
MDLKNEAIILILFGASGDLVRKKVLAALFSLFQNQKLPRKTAIIGFSRKPWSDSDFRQYIRKHLSSSTSSFLKLFFFQTGNFENPDSFSALNQKLRQIDQNWQTCSHKLFYLPIPPSYYETVLKQFARTNLNISCAPGSRWVKILVEKPFGKDLKTAQRLDSLLAKLFKEEQIYRIDHYLAKESLENILVFRAANSLFSHVWNRRLIKRIEIRLLEKIGVEERGALYDGLGALRDVGQNHLLQMLALATMSIPQSFTAKAIRRKRAEILSFLKPLTPGQIGQKTVRFQYRGYRKINGVSPRSTTETYFRLQASLDHPRWKNVPIILEAGKRLPQDEKEINIYFYQSNLLQFSLSSPNEISLIVQVKKPGSGWQSAEKRLVLSRQKISQAPYPSEYARLLLDCIRGDQTIFVSSQEVEAMWRFIDPILRGWQKNKAPLKFYQPGKLPNINS